MTDSTPKLVLSTTPPILSFLKSAIDDPNLSSELRQIASDLSAQPGVPYRLLRMVWSASEVPGRPELIDLISGSGFILSSPKPREKSDELKARLKKLADMAERKAYAELVKDITPKKEVDEPFSSYKDQIGFGLHVAVMMFTGYLVGYATFRALFNHSPAMNAAGGILGLIGGMLVETFLFIIKSTNQELRSSSSASKQNKKKKKKNE